MKTKRKVPVLTLDTLEAADAADLRELTRRCNANQSVSLLQVDWFAGEKKLPNPPDVTELLNTARPSQLTWSFGKRRA